MHHRSLFILQDDKKVAEEHVSQFLAKYALQILYFNLFKFRDVCELLLENEADVDHCDNGGRSPLWAAASMGHAPVVALLLFWGCCIDSMDSEGRTVLSVAAAQG